MDNLQPGDWLPAAAWQDAADTPRFTRRAFTSLASALLPMQSVAASQESRVALVIGNAAYPAAPLRNSSRDARAVAESLTSLGFSVVLSLDASLSQMLDALARTSELLKRSPGVGLFYFAGHGVQVDWKNYLLPINASATSVTSLRSEALEVSSILRSFRASGTRLNLVILDACRDNPLADLSGTRGLAPLDAPLSTYFAYATAPGSTADDGASTDQHGLYTRHLLAEIARPGAKIEEVFKRIRVRVRVESKGRQVPWDSSNLEEDFVFASGKATPAPTRNQLDATFSEEAKAWAAIADTRDEIALSKFLSQFSTGAFAELASFRLDQVSPPKVRPVQPTGIPVALPSGTNRYAVGDTFRFQRLDGHTKLELHEYRWVVTKADDTTVEINSGQLLYDQMGSLVRSPVGRKDPPLLELPGEVTPGKRWRCVYSNRDSSGNEMSRFYYRFVVLPPEDITVPFGTFRAYKIARSGVGYFPNGNLMSGESTSWYDPSTMTRLRIDLLSRNRQDRIIESYSDVLVGRERALQRA